MDRGNDGARCLSIPAQGLDGGGWARKLSSVMMGSVPGLGSARYLRRITTRLRGLGSECAFVRRRFVHRHCGANRKVGSPIRTGVTRGVQPMHVPSVESEYQPGCGFCRARAAFAEWSGPRRAPSLPVLCRMGSRRIADGRRQWLWYQELEAPFFTPPDWLLRPGLDDPLISRCGPPHGACSAFHPAQAQASRHDVLLSATQITSALWSIAFFTLQSPLSGSS